MFANFVKHQKMYSVWVLKSMNDAYSFIFHFLLGNPQKTGLMET